MARIHVYQLDEYTLHSQNKAYEFIYLYQFEDDEDQIVINRTMIEGLIERRQIYDPKKSYLVLHPTHSFTMNFKG